MCLVMWMCDNGASLDGLEDKVQVSRQAFATDVQAVQFAEVQLDLAADLRSQRQRRRGGMFIERCRLTVAEKVDPQHRTAERRCFEVKLQVTS